MTIERTTDGLANHIFDCLERMERSEMTPQELQARKAAWQQIYQLKRLELDAARFFSEFRDGDRIRRIPSLSFRDEPAGKES